MLPEPFPHNERCAKRCRHGGCIGTEGVCYGVCYCYGVRIVKYFNKYEIQQSDTRLLVYVRVLVINQRPGPIIYYT